MNQPLVSTIIPVFNRPAMLQEAVRSVLAQSYPAIEIIIVDDGSTDDTPAVIQQLQVESAQRVRSIRIPNSGPGLAREAGRQAAQGEFLQYLDSDDLLLPGKFEAQVRALQVHPECDIAYGKTRFTWIGQAPAPGAYRRTGEVFETLFPSFLVSRWWCTQTPLYRRSLTDRMGPWTGLWSEEDWEYDARAASFNPKLCFCDQFVSVQRAHQPELHLSHGSSTNPAKLRDRAKAHELILAHAHTAGMTHAQPEMQHFARALFLLSRQCGAAGLANESKRLFDLSRQAIGTARGARADYRLYEFVATAMGWRVAGRISSFLDRFRKS